MCLSPLAALSGRGGGEADTCVHSVSLPLTPLAHSHPTHTHFVVQTDRKPTMDFADDPFKDYRYEDPFNIADPFADVTDGKRNDPFARSSSVAGFETDDFFSASTTVNGSFTLPEKRSGRVSAPPVAYDPFATRSDFKLPPKPTAAPANNNETWAAWPNDNWASDDAWAKPAARKADAWTSGESAKKNINTSTTDWKTDNWANKSDNWAADWGATDSNRNLNETWPSNTLPSKKEKSPRPVKYAKSLVHTIGGIGRTKQKDKKAKGAALEAKSSEFLPTEEQQWAWAAAESRKLEAEAEKRRRQEDAELQLALAISRQEK